jgi:hypothetical protein
MSSHLLDFEQMDDGDRKPAGQTTPDGEKKPAPKTISSNNDGRQ